MKPMFGRLTAVVIPSLVLSFALPALGEVPASSASTAPVDDNARVRELFLQSRAAFKAGDAARAREQLLEAWRIRQTYDVASSLGQVEIALKLYSDAAEHLYFSIHHFAPVENEQTLDQVKQAFAQLAQHVAAVRIAVDQPGATVVVDDKSVGVAPLAAPVFLSPGLHSVHAQLGGDVVTKAVTAEAGKAQNIELKLGSTKISAGSGDQPAASGEDGGKSIVPVIVGGAVIAIGLGVGIGFRIAGSSNDDDARALQLRIPPGGCTGSSSASACGALRDAASSRDHDFNISTAGFAVAGVAAVATAAYWLFWPEESAPTSSALRVGGGLSSTGGAAWVGSRF